MHKIDFYNHICIMKILPVRKRLLKPLASVAPCASRQGAVPKVMSVALIEPEMTATLNVVVSINSTTVMQTYWTASTCECFCQPLSSFPYFHNKTIFVKSILCLIFKKLEFLANYIKLRFFDSGDTRNDSS